MNTPTQPLLITILLITILLLTLAACDPSSNTPTTNTTNNTNTSNTPNNQQPTPEIPHNPWTVPPTPENQSNNLENPSPFQTFSLTASDPALYPRCHEIFEPNPDKTNQPNAPLKSWPWISEASHNTQEAASLYGCNPEAYDLQPDGSRYIAYGIPNTLPNNTNNTTTNNTTNNASNLRLAAYAPDGQLRWHYLVDRSEQAKNFAANFRGSFIAHPSHKLTCVGTLWEGGTQTACFDHSQPLPDNTLNKEPTWTGSMNFWAGTRPIGLDNSLFSADIKGLTRRYPFNGTEMRHRDFETMGGRGALYTTDPQSLYFAPGTDDATLTAYNLPDMTPRWHLQLPDRPQTSYHHIAPAHDLLLIKITDTLYAIDTTRGTVRFALKIGVDHPPIATNNEHLYLLLRRPDLANLIYQIDPQTGRVLQVATAPTGTLDMTLQNQTLLLRSVRAVRTAQLP